ncbi:MAG: hypothetical protein JNK48_31260, partial [Bryobacterales bacterium]|nr:hypothetical protein [Bryobacterales bacterium]
MEANPKAGALIVLANVLLLLSALPTLLLVFEPTRRNPEGAVGFHLITIPIALLQVAALALAIRGGASDFLSAARPLLYGTLLPYFLGMNMLPVASLERGFTALLAKAAVVLLVAASFAAVNRLPYRTLSAALLSIACLAGLLLIAGELLPYFRGAGNLLARGGQLSGFDNNEIRFQAEEWSKLPETPPLWQLIQVTYSMNQDIRAKCLARIAALPNLQQESHRTPRHGLGRAFTPLSRGPLPRPLLAARPRLCGIPQQGIRPMGAATRQQLRRRRLGLQPRP